MRKPITVNYRAVHKNTPWRKVRGHTSLENALYGRKDGAPGLFDYRVRIDYQTHGDPLYAVIWEDDASFGYVVKRDTSSSDGTARVEVPIEVLLGYDRNGGASTAELEAHFLPEIRTETLPKTEATPSNLEFEASTLPEVEEGAVLLQTHLVRERNSGLTDTKKSEVLRVTGRLACEACGFDFAERYGEIGKGFCEVHHTRPLGAREGSEITGLADLAILCSNCHRIIHRTDPMWTVTELAAHLMSAKAPCK